MTNAINNFEDELDENNSEIETFSRDGIAVTIEYIMSWSHINIDIETALREKYR